MTPRPIPKRRPAAGNPADRALTARRPRPRLVPLGLAIVALLLGATAPVAHGTAAGSEAAAGGRGGDTLELPWRQAGLSERQAAAHLLDRFTFGARPGEVDRVVAMGLERWFERQLAADLPDERLERRLVPLSALDLPADEIARRYPNPGVVISEARRAGILDGDVDPRQLADRDQRELRRKVFAYARDQGYRPQRELIGQLLTQRLYRALYSDNQLRATLVELWFNHFYVSLADNEVRSFVLSYERDAIAPHVLGDFRSLLGATARHPAMLLYLDNARSTAGDDAATTAEERMAGRFGRMGRGMARQRTARQRMARQRMNRQRMADQERDDRRPQGLNENYARELLELHTLGVDGGYDQGDVEEVARAFTGWSVIPPGARMREELAPRIERAQRQGRRVGFVVEGDFIFRADAHDAGAKRVLGTKIAAGGGIEDGERVLDLLAGHPATARHVSRKLAVRYVSDEPPQQLVDRLAASWQRADGDLRQVLRTLVASPEFWAPEARRSKIKSPFELAVSALRALDAEVGEPRDTLEWVARMGQPLYGYQAPTGYPDRADFWVNTGALLARMSFGLQLAAGRVAGVEHDLPALAGGGEPASRSDALATYLDLLLPERDHRPTLEQLEAMIHDPELADRVDAALPEEEPASYGMDDEMDGRMSEEEGPYGRLFGPRRPRPVSYPPPTPVEQVVGVILGSPEFQRR